MRTLGEQDLNGVTRNLTTELSSARDHFANLAAHIKLNASRHRDAIVEQLVPFADAVYNSSRALSTTVAALIDSVDRAWTLVTPWLDGLEEMGSTVWSLALAIAVVVLLITGLLVASLSYGCARAENRAGTPFVVAAASMAIASVALSLFTVFGMLLGGHGEVFVCRSLYDQPDFVVLGRLFDRPGLLLQSANSSGSSAATAADDTAAGIISHWLRSGHTNNSSYQIARINSTLTDALQQCRYGAPSYGVFHLEALMHVAHNTDYTTNAPLVRAIDGLNVSADRLCSITAPLQSIFEDMYVIDVDLTAFRNEINQPTPERDMSTFIEQLQHVSMQVQDVGSTARMATLGNRARRLQASLLQPLEQVRSEIVYHLTALELQRVPWANLVNQSLLQLKTTQHFLDRDAAGVFAANVKVYRNR